ncbi:MAG: tetratricopeptide repeat protein [Polyangiaceae bacterium]
MGPPDKPVSPVVAIQVKLLRRAAQIHESRRNAPQDAIAVLERAVALVPEDRDVLLALCDAYAASGRSQDAANVLERIIASFAGRRTKELAIFHQRHGKVRLELGDKAAALRELDLAFKIDPGSITVLRDLGLLAFETGDLDRAQKSFRALLLQRLEPTSGITKAEVFYYLGEVAAASGDKAKAQQMFERALENDAGLERAKTRLEALKG